MKKFFTLPNIVYTLLFFVSANGYMAMRRYPAAIAFAVLFLLAFSIFAGMFTLDSKRLRLRICYHGGVLLTVCTAAVPVSLFYHAILLFYLRPDYKTVLYSAITWFAIVSVVFWCGIVCVYCTSIQLGIAMRIKGVLCAFIPFWNFVMLGRIIVITMKEIEFEVEKEHVNRARRAEKVCQTKYPILLVHGVFFRDSHLFNYWGRIPTELKNNGATIFYGEHHSAASVEDSAKELAKRIARLVEDTSCEKVNIIAHSKGGLDSRYAISEFGSAPFVASLTTINTPHRGCLFVDVLMKHVPERVKNKIASTYNRTLTHLGDRNPDFLAAVSDLTAGACKARNEKLYMPEDIYCQSVGSIQKMAHSGKFPLNYSYHLVKYFDGPNDGIVGENSFCFGQSYRLVTVAGDRGVSHCDMIDMNRENIDGFDVREFYVELVHDLKERGL